MVFDWPLSEFVTNSIFLAGTAVSLFVAPIEVLLSVLWCRSKESDCMRRAEASVIYCRSRPIPFALRTEARS